jgi:hypothetical protein
MDSVSKPPHAGYAFSREKKAGMVRIGVCEILNIQLRQSSICSNVGRLDHIRYPLAEWIDPDRDGGVGLGQIVNPDTVRRRERALYLAVGNVVCRENAEEGQQDTPRPD